MYVSRNVAERGAMRYVPSDSVRGGDEFVFEFVFGNGWWHVAAMATSLIISGPGMPMIS